MMKKTITGHYIVHWGVPTSIHVRSTAALELAVLEFAPEMFHRFATNGMSAHQDEWEGTHIGTELYLSSRSNESWIVDFLTTLAKYPLENDTFFSEFDTVPLGGPLRKNSAFTALLLAPPLPSEKGTFGSLEGAPGVEIWLLQVIGIFPAEYEFALEAGGEALWRKLVEGGEPLLLDEKRNSCV